ncbi:serine/threonine protein phosphatase 2C [Theileria orientalis]|uniref:Serine/threonine protein phosphatase 2C n=1 Tax=Theileria orientalis TaxID=68886 RepID=A0A976M713_THEOR|nr:serine/threonine protein phosphatase 2C [Theileria orientalis]
MEMTVNSISNGLTSLVQPAIHITHPVDFEDYGTFAVSAHTDIGSRKTQEDRLLIVPKLCRGRHNISFFGVFDGTVGDFSSDTIQKIIIKHLTESPQWEKLIGALEKGGDVVTCAYDAMFRMYKSADEELLGLCARLSHDYASSTSVTVLMVNQYIIVGHLGDSRVALCSNEDGLLTCKYLTQDHKPNNPEEKLRIISSGGSVEFLCSHSNNPFIRGGDFTVRKARGEQPMQLQYSRAFGGKDLKKYGLSSDPDITIFERKDKHKCIILASDGLWDIKSCEDAFKTLFQGHQQGLNPSKFLIESALNQQRSKSKNSDNITVISVFLKDQKPVEE